MANITKIAEAQTTEEAIVAKKAYIFYQQGNQTVCATRHTVHKNMTLSLGTVVNPRKIQSDFSRLNVANSQEETEAEITLLPDNILLNNTKCLVWFNRRKIQTMWFRLGDSVRGLDVEWPPLLYWASKEKTHLHIYALGKNKRPDNQSVIYHAPLMNINEAGRLCEGSATLPQHTTIANIARFESSLCDSQFTHINHDNTLKGGATDVQLYRYWQSKCGCPKPLRAKSSEFNTYGRFKDLLDQHA